MRGLATMLLWSTALSRRGSMVVRMSSTGAGAPQNSPPSRADAFSVAPMMEYTDMHQRNLFRMLSRSAVLYTEMVTTNALVRNEDDPRRFLEADFNSEQPVVLQLGGSEPRQMGQAARIARAFGYGEININCGCPSEKVADAGCFGAALMLNPPLVVELANAVGEATGRPATIKCRIGVNDDDSYEQLHSFVRTVSEQGGVRHFVIHARKAILGAKFSPDDNRKIPPLKYDFVFRLVADFPNLSFTLNGGVNTLDECAALLKDHPSLAGVMVGRACINSVFQWSAIDSTLYGRADPGLSRREIISQYAAYAKGIEAAQGARARRALVKPLLGLFTGEPNGRLFRAKLDDFLLREGGGLPVDQVILGAAESVPDVVLDLLPSQVDKKGEIYWAAREQRLLQQEQQQEQHQQQQQQQQQEAEAGAGAEPRRDFLLPS